MPRTPPGGCSSPAGCSGSGGCSIAVLQGRDRGRLASVTELALTPLVVVGIVLAAAADSLVGASVTMLGVGAAGCLILGVAVYRSEATGIDARAAAEAEPLQS